MIRSLLSFPLLIRGCSCFSTLQNRIGKCILERLFGSQYSRIHKITHGIKFIEVVLNWSAWQDDPSSCVEHQNRLCRFRLCILDPVSLVAYHETTSYFYQVVDVHANLFIRNNKHWLHFCRRLQKFLNRLLCIGRVYHCRRIDSLQSELEMWFSYSWAKPELKFLQPILNQSCRSNDDNFLSFCRIYDRSSMWTGKMLG